ncbi:glycyl-tRNA synthetase beta subunit [Candidatus Kinetoplastibacterium desouzaii TCC079E]|uniref:Glycine--tRNA ligase beta subunit n=1 Tax=Candidatus Kinetoplastidibacterium desouzai TCC079E TaxID=1208919 RepID=M1L2Y3_9PROT|nr:glycine--tRNA ligase subunit beta [Candidatus Kinetoplastibacterium desouzaii]AGF47113.1 glycyl-tRNA synthetase beta subunit [Candidatus Kinetoplastibacterium desouzaii TCC079E]
MSTQPLTIELITEELPPKKLNDIENSFKNSIYLFLKNNKVLTEDTIIQSYSTPRRLAVSFSKVLNKSPDIKKEERLMPKTIGIEENGKPTQTLLKKLKAKGLENNYQNKLKILLDGRQEFLIIENEIPGKTIEDILQEAITNTVHLLSSHYQSMRYQTQDEVSTVKFIRPARNLFVLFGTKVININALGLNATNKTIGHRFIKNIPLEIDRAHNYENFLEENGFVIPSYTKRKTYILKELEAKANEENTTLGNNTDLENLLNEVTATVEYPKIYIGSFNKSFLELPTECLILTMRLHQRYFPLFDKVTNKLTNKFLIVSNTNTNNCDNIVKGNQKVIHPRLADAKFFYDKDIQIPLIDRVTKLKNVIYHNKIGSQLDRVYRLKSISTYIANIIKIDPKMPNRAAELSKADLESLMVNEFPELQGIIGSYYAQIQGENSTVVAAIRDQYKNKFETIVSEENIISAILFIAERIENLIGMFSIKIYPTGESDQFGLRRAALGIISAFEQMEKGNIFKNKNNTEYLSISELSNMTFSLFENNNLDSSTPEKVIIFIYERYKNQLIKNFERDTIEAVLSKKPPLHQILPIITSINDFKKTSYFTDLISINKRINNFLKKSPEQLTDLNHQLLENESERLLVIEILKIENDLAELLKLGEFKKYLILVSSLTKHIEIFFEENVVMDNNELIRNNRLNILSNIKSIINNFVDISYLAT